MKYRQHDATRIAGEARRLGTAAARADGPEAARRRLLRVLDRELAALPAADRGPVACRAGCALCCHLRVMATASEVFGLIDYLERTLDADGFEAFRARVRAAAARLAEVPAERVLATNLPCPVLVDGRCSGYAARPFNCRAYHSLDRDACQDAFDAPERPGHGHPQYAAVARVHEGVQRGLRDAHADAGYDHRQYELVAALAAALEDRDARTRFEGRAPAFAQ